MNKKGELYVLSPIEFLHAFLYGLHASLTSGNEQLMQQWRAAALHTSFRFVICEGEDDRHFKAKQLREDAGANYTGVRQTALARIFELVKFRERKERTSGKMTNEDVAKLYAGQVTFSTMTDASERPTSKDFVENAMSVHRRVLSTKAKELLLAIDEQDMVNPLDSVSKLITLATKAKTEENIVWSVEMILDYVRCGALAPEQVGTRALEGKLAGQNGRGLVDIVIYKKGFLSHMLNTVLPTFTWEDGIKASGDTR